MYYTGLFLVLSTKATNIHNVKNNKQTKKLYFSIKSTVCVTSTHTHTHINSQGWWCSPACGACWIAWGSPSGCWVGLQPGPSAPCSNWAGGSTEAAWTGLWGFPQWSRHICDRAKDSNKLGHVVLTVMVSKSWWGFLHYLALVSATLRRLGSLRKPMPWCSLALTQERMMKSFSLPWKASTLAISTSCTKYEDILGWGVLYFIPTLNTSAWNSLVLCPA